MSTDTSFGEVRFFEDFLGVAIADVPNMDIESNDSGADEILAGSADGRYRITLDGDSGDDEAGITFTGLNWTAGDGYLKMEARIIIDDITDYKLFVGFGDAIASDTEQVFSATSDVVSSEDHADAIGILYDGDASTSVLWCCAQRASSITANGELGSVYTPVAAVPTTLGVYLSKDRKSAVWYVDGTEVYRIDAAADALVTAVDLIAGVWCADQSNATSIDVDYIYCSKGRSTS